jgi:hypothetical protein
MVRDTGAPSHSIRHCRYDRCSGSQEGHPGLPADHPGLSQISSDNLSVSAS